MDTLSSINLSSIEEKEDQQIVTLVDASDIGDSNQLVHILDSNSAHKKSSKGSQPAGPHCLICNGKLVVSARGAMDIFSDKVKTSTRNLDLNLILGNILNRELDISNIHSSIICKKCYKLIDYIDCVEGQLIEMKQEITKKFLYTEALVKDDCNNGTGDIIDDPLVIYPRVTNGDKEYKIHPIKSKNKRGRRGRGRKCSLPPDLVKLEVKEESDDILSTCFSLEEGNSGIEEDPEIDDVDEEEIGICSNPDRGNVSEDVDVYDIDGLDLHCTGNSIQIGETFVPTISDEAHAGINAEEEYQEKGLGRFRCRYCKLRNHSLKYIQTHLYKCHSDQLLECEVCEERLPDWPKFLKHLAQHFLSGAKPFCCNHCSRNFTLNRQLQEHLWRHFGGKPISCYRCPKIFRRESALEEHMNIHTGAKPFLCELCFKRFFSKSTLKAHMKIHGVRNRDFKCSVCKKLFLTSHHLNEHVQIHENSKLFICPTCNKGFCTQRSLDLHLVIHSGIKNYFCRMCNKAFARKGEVEDHERIHTGEKPFQCEICGSQFSQRSNLLTHKRSTHLKEKRYECSQCNKAFKRRRLLVYHIMSIHTGERPYKCDYCKAAFVYPEHFKKHLRIHSGEKPFKCEVCGKAFNSRDNKNAHKFIHSDKKQYECTLCGIGFMRKPLLVAHIRQHGSSENEETFIKVNPASIVDSEIENEITANAMEQTLEHIQLVHPVDTDDVQVLNRPIIVGNDGISRYILPNQIVEVRDDDLDELTASQLNHIAEVSQNVESSDPSVDDSEHIQQETGDEYIFQIQLDEEGKITAPHISRGSPIGNNIVKRLKNNSLSPAVRHVQVSIMPGTFKKLTQSQNNSPVKTKSWSL